MDSQISRSSRPRSGGGKEAPALSRPSHRRNTSAIAATVSTWIDELASICAADAPAVLVTVARTQGSTPRAPGAHLIVAADGCHGSIGGGQLEQRAIAHARTLLADRGRGAERVRFPLGASAGQCCGGVMELVFEPVGPAAEDWIARARILAASGRPWGRHVPLDGGPTRVFDADSVTSAFDLPAQTERARSLLAGAASSATLARAGSPDGDPLANACLIDVCLPPELEVVLFGAGHVGRALAEVFGRLPMQVRWVDSRADEFPATVAPNIEVICTDVPESEVRSAPADAVFLVLTHSHALDFELVKAILARADFRLCGLLGSQGKRARFEHQLRARGVPEGAIARLHCPIGVPEVVGKEPEIIAIAVAAELLQLRGASVLHRLSP